MSLDTSHSFNETYMSELKSFKLSPLQETGRSAPMSDLHLLSKSDLNDQLREAFHEQQRSRKDRQVHRLIFAKGLGKEAEKTLFEGLFTPRVVLPSLSLAMSKFYSHATHSQGAHECVFEIEGGAYANDRDITKNYGGANIHSSAKSAEVLQRNENDNNTRLDTRDTEKESDSLVVKTITNSIVEVEASIDAAERKLDDLCKPYISFNAFLEILSMALEAVERGDCREVVTLSVATRADPDQHSTNTHTSEVQPALQFTGAEEVMRFILENILDTAYALVPVSHSCQWVTNYNLAFLRSLNIMSQAEAQERLKLLARCVRLLGSTEHFSATLLSFESIIQEYDAFYTLKDSAMEHIEAVLDEIDTALQSVRRAPFPERRARLQGIEREIKDKLQRVLFFLNELDASWRPTIQFHLEWKDKFLSLCFFRIHRVITPCFAFCSFGYIEKALYNKVNDSRVTGRFFGSTPLQPQVLLARRVEFERTKEKLNLQQIGMSVKGNASLVVGYQVCMGARFVLCQSTPEYDEEWGFHMNENVDASSVDDVNNFLTQILAHTKNKVATEKSVRKPRSTTFITQCD